MTSQVCFIVSAYGKNFSAGDFATMGIPPGFFTSMDQLDYLKVEDPRTGEEIKFVREARPR